MSEPINRPCLWCGNEEPTCACEMALPAIVLRLLSHVDESPGYHNEVMEEAAEMLNFFFGQLQMHSPKMDGQHSYRFLNSGWPMGHLKGPTAEDAVRAAIAEIKRSKEK